MELLYKASGKFLLFGEYLALHDADTLAIPLKFGQTLIVKNNQENYGFWLSKQKENEWFQMHFHFRAQLELILATDEEIAEKLLQLLNLIYEVKPSLFAQGLSFEMQSDFDFQWGLGSSSTLISLLSQWSEINPYYLLEKSFGGSGYDIACATAQNPIVYNRKQQQVQAVDLADSITEKILFVYTGKKQNSQKEVKRFEAVNLTKDDIQEQNAIIHQACTAKDILEWEDAMMKNETLIARILGKPNLKTLYFQDYPYAIKSLGAWGGDFFMATFRDEQAARDYFLLKGYPVQFNYQEIIYQ